MDNASNEQTPTSAMRDAPLCACGCGEPAPIAPQTMTRYGWIKGQARPYRQGHHAKNRPTKGYRVVGETRIHRVRAERALGKSLPPEAVVHHADGSKGDDSQLVICQDQAYHLLLHARMSVVSRGGNPNTEKICHTCQVLQPKSAFCRNQSEGDGLNGQCRSCKAQYDREHPRSRRPSARIPRRSPHGQHYA